MGADSKDKRSTHSSIRPKPRIAAGQTGDKPHTRPPTSGARRWLVPAAVLLPVLAMALAAPAGPPAEAQPPSLRAFLPLLVHRATPAPAAIAPSPTATRSASPTTPRPTTPATPTTTSTVFTTSTPISTPTALPPGDACGDVPTFEEGLRPDLEIHVAPDGDDAGGDGTAGRPFRTIARAARLARPGAAIRLHPGTYAGGTFLETLQGRPDAPMWLGGLPGAAPAVIEGGGEGLHLVRPRWLVVHDLVLRGARSNGLNADDGGDVADPLAAHHVVFRGLDIDEVGGTGNQDCLKLSGLNDVVVLGSRFARCGGGGSGSGIDMVGVHRALVARSTFEDISGNAVQVKGGSADVEIRWNRMQDAGQRAVNMGGSTGLEFFRPPLVTDDENAEARRVRLVANLIQGSDTPWAFVGCVDCLAAHNTVVEPSIWLMRILQETSSQGDYRFAPARDGQVINNLFVFLRGQIRADVNVGGGTAPETFRFAHNLWFARDDPARSAPRLPVAEQGGVVGRDPLLGADGAIPPGSPAAGAGLAGDWAPGDLAGRCWREPPSIGAMEAAVP